MEGRLTQLDKAKIEDFMRQLAHSCNECGFRFKYDVPHPLISCPKIDCPHFSYVFENIIGWLLNEELGGKR